jgi:hypothetical protein
VLVPAAPWGGGHSVRQRLCFSIFFSTMALSATPFDPKSLATAGPDPGTDSPDAGTSVPTAPDTSEEAAADPTTSTAPVDPEGDTDASASNTTDVHPL